MATIYRSWFPYRSPGQWVKDQYVGQILNNLLRVYTTQCTIDYLLICMLNRGTPLRLLKLVIWNIHWDLEEEKQTVRLYRLTRIAHKNTKKSIKSVKSYINHSSFSPDNSLVMFCIQLTGNISKMGNSLAKIKLENVMPQNLQH